MANKWISFLKSWRAKHKGVSLKDSMKKASVDYRKSSSSTAEAAPKKRKRRKKKT